MALQPGARLGPYEILSALGAGGMGEVYRARDSRLERDVAIKFLPEAFAADAERVARFQREAKVLASLNHPNIAAIHGLEQADGARALVMELVGGEDLAQRIARGAIPIDEALPIARQIAEALEAAHEQGIIHRDLKPANIKVRPDGAVKVLDFGLAKALDPIGPASVNVTASPTITSPAMMTGVGVLLGTAAYMSPEQARGKPVDKRSDIWAFACVLFEMLTGKRAFAGDEVSDVQAGPLSRVSARAGEPGVVTRTVQGHLSHRLPQFLPDGRHFLFFVQGSAAAQGIYWGSLDGGEPRRMVASDTAGAWAPPDRLLFVRQGALVATPFDTETGEITGEPVIVADHVGVDPGMYRGGFSVSANGRIAYRAGGVERRQLTWFERDGKAVGTAGSPDETGLFYPELSPDGRRVAVTRAGLQNNGDVWLMDLTRGGTTRFTFDPAFDFAPLWSPDGTRIAFRSNRKGIYDLYVKPSSGVGNEELLLESTASKSPLSWSSDGRFLLFYELEAKTNHDLWTLPLTGDGKPSRWLNTPFIETLGQFSPDGRWVAYQSNESGPFEVYVQPFPAASAKWQISTQGGTMPRWRPDGKELFFIAPDAKLMAAAVAASNATFEAAPPVALFQTRIVGGPGQILKHQYAASRDGRFLINEPAEASTATPITLILNWQPRS